jgi:hypothetical protein
VNPRFQITKDVVKFGHDVSIEKMKASKLVVTTPLPDVFCLLYFASPAHLIQFSAACNDSVNPSLLSTAEISAERQRHCELSIQQTGARNVRALSID